jgi:hypothetical protein
MHIFETVNVQPSDRGWKTPVIGNEDRAENQSKKSSTGRTFQSGFPQKQVVPQESGIETAA